VTLRLMPGGGGRWTATRLDAVEMGPDKVGDNGLNYRLWQCWGVIVSIRNPSSLYSFVLPRSRLIHNFLVTR